MGSVFSKELVSVVFEAFRKTFELAFGGHLPGSLKKQATRILFSMHHFAMVTVENVRILHIEYTSNCIVELWDRTGSRYILVVIGVQIKNARYFEFRSSHSLLKTVWVRNKYYRQVHLLRTTVTASQRIVFVFFSYFL